MVSSITKVAVSTPNDRFAPTLLTLHSVSQDQTGNRGLISTLKTHIDNAIALILEGNYIKVIEAFHDEETAKKIGYKLNPLKKIRLVNIEILKTIDEISTISDLAAALSGINKNKKTINVYQVLTTVATPELKKLLELELMLLNTEEWIHALQDLNNWQPISSHGPQIQAYCDRTELDPCEIEIADYFLDRGIPIELLNKTRWFERYERKKVISEILGIN